MQLKFKNKHAIYEITQENPRLKKRKKERKLRQATYQREFNTLVIKMFNGLRRSINDFSEDFNRKIVSIKKGYRNHKKVKN